MVNYLLLLLLQFIDGRHGKCFGKNLLGEKWGHCGKDKYGNFTSCQAKYDSFVK